MSRKAEPRESIVVAISDKSRVELEWILPLIDEFTTAGQPVRVFDLAPVREADPDAYWMRALRLVLGRDARRLVDLEPIPRTIARFLDYLRNSDNKTVARIGALYFSRKSPLIRFTPLGRWRKTHRKRAFDRLFRNCAALFVQLIDGGWPDGTGEAELIAAANDRSVSVVGFPPVVDHEIRFKQPMPCDMALANTPKQAAEWEKATNARVLAATPPKFTHRWLNRLSEIQDELMGHRELPTDRRTALVILKNDNSAVWDGLEFHETASEILTQLFATGVYILVKPHPRQNREALHALLATIDESRYTLVDGPLAYWARRADIVVSLFSGGVLDCLAVDRVAILYWPMTERYREKIASGDVPDAHVRRQRDGLIGTKYRQFCIEVTTPTFALPNSVDAEPRFRIFRRHYPAADDCREIRDAVMSLAAPRERHCAPSTV